MKELVGNLQRHFRESAALRQAASVVRLARLSSDSLAELVSLLDAAEPPVAEELATEGPAMEGDRERVTVCERGAREEVLGEDARRFLKIERASRRPHCSTT